MVHLVDSTFILSGVFNLQYNTVALTFFQWFLCQGVLCNLSSPLHLPSFTHCDLRLSPGVFTSQMYDGWPHTHWSSAAMQFTLKKKKTPLTGFPFAKLSLTQHWLSCNQICFECQPAGRDGLWGRVGVCGGWGWRVHSFNLQWGCEVIVSTQLVNDQAWAAIKKKQTVCVHRLGAEH